MKKLHLVFLNEQDKKVSFKPTACDENLSAELVKDVMEGIVALDLIERKGIKQYTAVDTAKYVETIITPLF